MKYFAMISALIVSTSTFAFNQPSTATIINSTETNIQIEYLICTGNVCNDNPVRHYFFTDASSHFLVNLNPNQNIRMISADEIDHQGGNPIPFGAHGSFDGTCRAYAGQMVNLIPGRKGTRTVGMIFCESLNQVK